LIIGNLCVIIIDKISFRTLNIINILFFWIFFWDHLVFSIIPYFYVGFLFFLFLKALPMKKLWKIIYLHIGKNSRVIAVDESVRKKVQSKNFIMDMSWYWNWISIPIWFQKKREGKEGKIGGWSRMSMTFLILFQPQNL
jgi:hypothetical protein